MPSLIQIHRSRLSTIIDRRRWSRIGLARAAGVSEKQLRGYLNDTPGFNNPSLMWLDKVYDAALNAKPLMHQTRLAPRP